MAACHIHGRLWTEIHNLCLNDLWMHVRLTPIGDAWMRGESYQLIKKRISLLEGKAYDEISLKCDKILEGKKILKNISDPVVKEWENCGGWLGGLFTCGIIEDYLYEEM